MKKFAQTTQLILFIFVLILINCGRNLDDVKMLPYSGEELHDLDLQKKGGEGDDEFLRKESMKVAKKEIKNIEKIIYYTYRTAMRKEDWEKTSDTLPVWHYTNRVIPLWKDKIRPHNELELNTQSPWEISSYDFNSKGFYIYPSDLSCLLKKNEDKFKLALCGPKVSICFGDVTPTAYKRSDGTLKPSDSQWYYNKETNVLFTKASKRKAKKIINKFKKIREIKLKVYYKLKYLSWCYIVKIEGFDQNDELIFETELDTNDSSLFRVSKYSL